VTRPQLAPHIAQALRADSHRIVITGAGGWLGKSTLDLLHLALGDAEFERRVIGFGSEARDLRLRCGKTVHQRPLAELAALERGATWVLHFAFLTKDKAEAMDESAYVAANHAMTHLVRSALTPVGADGVFVASSGAARLATDERADPAMRLYGALKASDEEIFADWATATTHAAVIARIFNVSGRYISRNKAYALADFIRSAKDEGAIRIRAPRRVIRSYVAISELLSVVFALLLDPAPRVARFDTGGEPIELAALADSVAQAIGHVSVTRAPMSEADDIYVGDRTAYDALRAIHAIPAISLAEQVRETLSDWELHND